MTTDAHAEGEQGVVEWSQIEGQILGIIQGATKTTIYLTEARRERIEKILHDAVARAIDRQLTAMREVVTAADECADWFASLATIPDCGFQLEAALAALKDTTP